MCFPCLTWSRCCRRWEPNSYGYHGDDGKACHGGLREPYGPQFTASDVVGAGINYLTQTIFFTSVAPHHSCPSFPTHPPPPPLGPEA